MVNTWDDGGGAQTVPPVVPPVVPTEEPVVEPDDEYIVDGVDTGSPALRLAQNLAISRGIDPSAGWVENLGGIADTNKIDLSGLLDYGYTFDDEGNLVSPDGYTISIADVLSTSDTYDESAYAQILADSFPSVQLAPDGMDDAEAKLLGYLPRGELKSFIDGKISEAETQLEQAKLASSVLFPMLTFEAITTLAEKRPDVFVQELRDIGRNADSEALLRALYPDITDSEMRSVFGDPAIMTEEEFVNHLNGIVVDPNSNLMPVIGGIIAISQIVASGSLGLNVWDAVDLANHKEDIYVGNEWLKDKYDKYVEYMNSPAMQNSFVRSVNAGYGDIQLQLANGAKWLGQEGVGNYFASLARVNQNFEVITSYKGFSWEYLYDPDWWATVGTRAITSQIPLIALSVFTGGRAASIAGALKLGVWGTRLVTAVGGSTLPTLAESGIEAGMAYDQALTDGLSPAEAKEVADKVFRENLLLLGGSNAVEFALAFTPIKKISKTINKLVDTKLVKVGKVAGKLTVIGLTEAGQEWYQEIISRQALGQEIKWDDEMKLTVALGGLFGVMFGGGAMTVSAIQSRVYNSLPTPLQNTFEEVKKNAIESGMTEEQAINAALDVIAEDKDGGKVIEAVAKQLQVEEVEKVLTSKNHITKAKNDRVISQLKQKVSALNMDIAEAKEAVIATPEGQVFDELSRPVENGQAKSIGTMAWGALFKNVEQRNKSIRTVIIDYIEKYVPKEERGEYLRAVSNAKTWNDYYSLAERIDKQVAKYNHDMLLKKIKAELKKIKPRVVNGIKRGKLVSEDLDRLNNIIKNWDMPRGIVLENIELLMNKLDTGEVDFVEYSENLESIQYNGVAEMTNTELSDTLDYIKAVINHSRISKRELAEEYAAQREANINKAVEVISGGKGITSEPPSESVLQSTKNFFSAVGNWQIAFTDLMDKISQKEGADKYKGWFNRFADNKISRARNSEEDGKRTKFEQLQNAFIRIYKVSSNRSRNKLANEQKHNKIDLGYFTDASGKRVHMIHTKHELFDFYLAFKDEVKVTEYKENNDFTDEMIDTIKSSLTSEDIEFCDWLMNSLANDYDSINAIYKQEYGIDLSRGENYWPRSRDVYKSDTSEHIMQMRDRAGRASTLSPSLKVARKNRTKYKVVSALDKYSNYIIQMEHFKAWTPTIKELRSVFGSVQVRDVITEYYGRRTIDYINEYINDLARGGIESTRVNNWIDKLRGNFSVAVLGLKPMIAVKQPIAILGFMTEMPYYDFVTGVADFFISAQSHYQTMYSRSPLLRERYKNGAWERDFSTKYKKSNMLLSTNMPMSDFFLSLIKYADVAGTVPGMWAMYKYSLKTMSEEDAILAAEQAVSRTQNTSYLETLSKAQRENSWVKLLTMFMDQPNKYFRLIASSSRVLFSNAHTPAMRRKAFTDILILWVVLPCLFQFMSDGFKWRPDRQGRAVILGPINYMLLVGPIAQSVFGWVSGEKYPYEPSPVLQIADDFKSFISSINKLIEDGKDPYGDISMDDVIKMVEYLAKAAGEATGIPTPYLIQVEKAIREGKPINLLFSDWALEEPEPDDYTKASLEVDKLGLTTLSDEEYAKWQEDILNGVTSDPTPIFTMSNLNSKFNQIFGSVLPEKVLSMAGTNGLLKEWATKEQAWASVGILPNINLTDINTYSDDDTIVQYRKQWLERSKLTSLADIKKFDAEYPKAYLGNISEVQYNALLQWINISKLPDTKEGKLVKDAFLKAHPEINTNPREQYLRDNPDVNAKLFIFGQANLYTYKSFKEVIKLVEKYNIPIDTLNKTQLAKIPTEKIWGLLDAYNVLPEGSKRTSLRKQFPELDAYLVKTKGYKPVNNNWLKITDDKIFALSEYNKRR